MEQKTDSRNRAPRSVFLFATDCLEIDGQIVQETINDMIPPWIVNTLRGIYLSRHKDWMETEQSRQLNAFIFLWRISDLFSDFLRCNRIDDNVLEILLQENLLETSDRNLVVLHISDPSLFSDFLKSRYPNISPIHNQEITKLVLNLFLKLSFKSESDGEIKTDSWSTQSASELNNDTPLNCIGDLEVLHQGRKIQLAKTLFLISDENLFNHHLESMDEYQVSSFIDGQTITAPVFNLYSGMAFKCESGWDVKPGRHCTGSTVEFNIITPLNCIGDLDVMYQENRLATTDRDFKLEDLDVTYKDETFELYLFEQNKCPDGYGYLKYIGSSHFNWDTGKYEHIAENYGHYLSNKQEGPAETSPVRLFHSLLRIPDDEISIDEVVTIRCHNWPPAAAEWISRKRKYGLPSNEIIRKVVQSGCDIVCSKHWKYTSDERMHRLSFSRAEVIIMKEGWARIHQIAYHLLRYFCKTALTLSKKDTKKNLCSYHLKTLVLWVYEGYPIDWWESKCLVEISWELLKSLLQRLKDNSCSNYFIPSCNLFNFDTQSREYKDTIKILAVYGDMNILNDWFKIEYVKKYLKQESDVIDQ